MKTTKSKISLIISLVLAVMLSLAALFVINTGKGEAFAESNVTISNTNVFTASGQANVIADKQKDGEDDVYYTMFTFAFKDDAVAYRRNLAYHWYEGEGKPAYFNMQIGFNTTSFDKFILKFESEEYSKTEDGKATNYIIFFPAENDGAKVYALITDDKEAALKGDEKAIDAKDITIKFTEKSESGYKVSVGGADYIEGEFKNVGGNYVKNSSSNVAPITFSPFYEDGTEENDGREAVKLVLYSLNGQSFKLNSSSVNHNEEKDYYYGGTVKDNIAPVLCLDDDVYFLELGKAIDLKYTVIDVLRTAPSSEINYYLLTWEQFEDKDGDYEDYSATELFTKVSSSDTKLLVSGKNKYKPTESVLAGTAFADEKLPADMLAKVYIKVTDTTSSGESANVYLDWYIQDNYKVKVKDSPFIAVANDKLGATYNYGENWAEIVKAYQDGVTEAAKGLSAGSSSYIYLPSAKDLFADNATSYEDLTFAIYYKGSSQSSNTGRAYNNLTINVTSSGEYTFTIYATDKAGNPMYYLDENGETVEFKTGEIWDIFGDEERYDKLPWFNFRVAYTGVTFDKVPGMQTTAYVGTSYSPSSFSIKAESGKYETKYRLFLFDRAEYYEKTGKTLSYDEYVEKIDELFEDGASRRAYFTEIPALSSMDESDEEYEKYKDYNWSSSGTSFTPQDDNAFYLIRAEATDTNFGEVKTCNMGVVASVKAKSLKGESDWLKNNVASVILLSVAGLSLVGIILLLVIKPKNSGDVEAEFERVQSKNKKK